MLVGQKIGPFAVEKELGSGAMGTVYRARYLPDDLLVALKIIAFGLSGNDSALSRFEREAGILHQLKHPNIVRLHSSGKWRGTPFFAMEYVSGESLDRIMARKDRFTWQEIVTIGKQLCSALQYAHEKGIVHRDLKPSNLMMAKDGSVKLTDFGIAKDLDVTALTGANNTIGTAAYMSPEQCRGEKSLTGKSDLYSLGVLFFELLTGRKPFIAESSVDMFLMHVNEPPPRVRGQPGCMEVPQALDTLVHQLMEKKPDLRPRDATMVAQILEEIEEKEAARISRGEEVAKARIMDHIEAAPLDEKDREAAKLIRAGSKKKKVKKKQVAFYRQGWFVTVGSLSLLAVIAVTLWWLFRPDSVEEMRAAIEKAKTPEAKMAAAKSLLDTYGKKKDDPRFKDHVEFARVVYWDGKVAKRESQLLKRLKFENMRNNPESGDDPDAYRKTMRALAAEEDGDVVEARKLWKELIDKFKDNGNEDLALWGWVAAKRNQDLVEVDERAAQIRKTVDEMFYNDRDVKNDGELEARAVEATRLEVFGDQARAFERWERMSKELKSKPEQRVWYLLAGKKLRELEQRKPSPSERKEKVQGVLKVAESEFASVIDKPEDRVTPRIARNRCRDIRDLYAGDENLKAEVDKAKALLEKHRPR
jgi:eukaryotic-like serine/threonine-protein kinase